MAEALAVKQRITVGDRLRKIDEKQWDFEPLSEKSEVLRLDDWDRDKFVGAGFMPARLNQLKTGKWTTIVKRATVKIAPTVILLFLIIYSGVLLRFFDPTAAVPDIGILAVLLLAVFSAVIFYQVARWLTDKIFGKMLGLDQTQRIMAFKSMQPWQIGLYAGCFISFFWGCVVVLTVMM